MDFARIASAEAAAAARLQASTEVRDAVDADAAGYEAVLGPDRAAAEIWSPGTAREMKKAFRRGSG